MSFLCFVNELFFPIPIKKIQLKLCSRISAKNRVVFHLSACISHQFKFFFSVCEKKKIKFFLYKKKSSGKKTRCLVLKKYEDCVCVCYSQIFPEGMLHLDLDCNLQIKQREKKTKNSFCHDYFFEIKKKKTKIFL